MRPRRSLPTLLTLLMLALFASPVRADVTMPAIFSDNMVLQRDAAVPVWGKAAPSKIVRVTLAGKSAEATAGPDGRWRVELAPMPAGGPYEMKVSDGNAVTFSNVLIGDVYLASGQSNMHMQVRLATDGTREVAAADFPRIRIITVPEATAAAPLDDFAGSWTPVTPETIANFSAVAYFFGREIHQHLDVPVGLIHCSWSGSVAESWISAPTFAAIPALSPMLDAWKTKESEYDGKTPLKRGKDESGYDDPRLWKNHPSNLYNGMLAPVVPYALRGVIWYQGEGNSGRAAQYRTLFPALISDWRAAWGRSDLPFLFVQLANYRQVPQWPREENWPQLREAQLTALSMPDTAMAVAIDLGDAADVHPKNKQEVGRRLALAARRLVYGEELVASGPLYKSFAVEGNSITITFTKIASGLVAKDSKPLRAFAIAGADREFVWADAVIDGDTVVVSSPQVPRPVAVRYAWSDNPGQVNLHNREGLPAAPFRTDDWPLSTASAPPVEYF